MNFFKKLLDTGHTETENDSGTVTHSGFVDEFNVDYNTELTGPAGMLRLHKMALSEAMAGTILRGTTNIIKSVNWQFKELDSDVTDQEKKVMDFLNWYWFDKYPSFSKLINKISTLCKFGHSVFEIIWQDIEYENNKYLVLSLEQRLATSIEYIRTKAKYIQFINANGTIVDIPFEHLVFFIIDQEGEDMRGKSLLREAYKSFKHKVIYEGLMGIGMQRNAAGTPWIKVPVGMNVNSKAYIAIKNLAKNLITHERGFAITEDNVDIKILENNFDPEKSLKVIQYLDHQMAISVLQQFVLLGQQGKGGAYALGRDQSDMYLDGLQYIVDIIAETFNKSVNKTMIEVNFAGVDASKFKLIGLDLNKRAAKELAEIYGINIKSGGIKNTLNDEVWLRKMFKYPELSEEEIASREKIDEKNDFNNPKKKDNKDKPIKLSENATAIQKQRTKFLDDNIKSCTFYMQEQLTMIAAKLSADIRNVLNRGSVELKGLKNIELSGLNKYNAGLQRKLATVADIGWKTAKKNAIRNKVKLAEAKDLSDLELRAFIINQSEEMVESQTSNMKSKSIFKANSSSMKGFSVDQTMARVNEDIDKFIAGNTIQVAADAAVTQSLNFGWDKFNFSIGEELWGFRFANDAPVTDICQFYLDKTFSIGSAELSAATPLLHPRCKSWMDPIYKANTPEKPNIDNVIAPPSIQKTAKF